MRWWVVEILWLCFAPSTAWAQTRERLLVLQFSADSPRVMVESLQVVAEQVRGAVARNVRSDVSLVTVEATLALEEAFGAACTAEEACPVRIAQAGGAAYVISGVVRPFDDGDLILALRLEDARTGTLLASRQGRAEDMEGLFGQVDLWARQLLLDAKMASPTDRVAVASMPSNAPPKAVEPPRAPVGPDLVEVMPGLRLRRVGPATFVMGSPETDPGRGADERQHAVTLSSAYYVMDTEVSCGLWSMVMGHSAGSKCRDPSLPWVGFTPESAEAFVAELRSRTGIALRLPTEAEWEYAARGPGLRSLYAGGDELHRVGRVQAASRGPSSQFLPNGFGLYDMTGNVRELTADAYVRDFGDGPLMDPKYPPTSGGPRVVRGCSYSDAATACRVTNRVSSSEWESDDIGLRLAVTDTPALRAWKPPVAVLPNLGPTSGVVASASKSDSDHAPDVGDKAEVGEDFKQLSTVCAPGPALTAVLQAMRPSPRCTDPTFGDARVAAGGGAIWGRPSLDGSESGAVVVAVPLVNAVWDGQDVTRVRVWRSCTTGERSVEVWVSTSLDAARKRWPAVSCVGDACDDSIPRWVGRNGQAVLQCQRVVADGR